MISSRSESPPVGEVSMEELVWGCCCVCASVSGGRVDVSVCLGLGLCMTLFLL